MFGPKRGGVTREWRKLYNEERNDLYCSTNVVWVIKSRRMRWAGHVACVRESRHVYRVLMGKPEGMRPLVIDPGIDERIILIWIFRRWDVGIWTGWSWLRIGAGGGHL